MLIFIIVLTRSAVEPKNSMSVSSNQTLFQWLREMKDIWRDFNAHEGVKADAPVKWLPLCQEAITQENPSATGFFNGSECHRFGIAAVNGTFENGLLEGMVTITKTDKSLIRVPFRKGSMNGLCREFACPFGACDFSEESWNLPKWLKKVKILV